MSRAANEKELFLLVARGDEAAYTEIFHSYTPKLFPYILKIAGDEQLARELLQETFLKLWVNRTDLVRIDNPSGWLYKIAANVCLTHLRSLAVRDRLRGRVYEAMAPARYDNITETLEAKEVELLIHNAVNILTEKQKEVYLLSRREGLSHQEIAEKMNVSVNTVKTHIGLALKSLQETLSKQTGLSVVTLAVILGG